MSARNKAHLLIGKAPICDSYSREFRHRTAQAAIAEELGMKKDNIFVLQSGNVLELSSEKGSVVNQVTARGIFVDGLGVGDVGNIVIRDRHNLSENGVIIVVLTMEKSSNQILAGPDIVSRGFIYVRESEELMKEARFVVNNTLDKCMSHNNSDWGKIKSEIKDDLNDFFWKKMKRSPVILPVFMEV